MNYKKFIKLTLSLQHWYTVPMCKINGASEPAVMNGMRIRMIPGDERNAKVTTAKDLAKFRETVSF